MKGQGQAVSYDRRISFVAPATLADRVTAAAQEQMTSINAWLRAACVERLRKENEVQRPARSA
jgi:hypothetical protein